MSIPSNWQNRPIKVPLRYKPDKFQSLCQEEGRSQTSEIALHLRCKLLVDVVLGFEPLDEAFDKWLAMLRSARLDHFHLLDGVGKVPLRRIHARHAGVREPQVAVFLRVLAPCAIEVITSLLALQLK